MSLMPERCPKCMQYHGCPPWYPRALFRPLPEAEADRLRHERDCLLAWAEVYIDGHPELSGDPTYDVLKATVAMCHGGER